MNKEEIFSDSFIAMGTRCDIVLAGVQELKAEQTFQMIKKEVEHLEHRLSRFMPDSPISKLNGTKKNRWMDVPDDIWDILTICYDFYQMSNGAFDITVTPLIDLWKKQESPSEAEIQNAQKSCGFDKVEFDFDHQKIKFASDKIQFDLGAIGKGFALDTIKPLLQNQGIACGIVSFGESSILAIGSHPNGENWPLGIRNNYRIDEFVYVFPAKNETVTTSGSILSSDEGFVDKHNHIISPVSGLPVEGNRTVSVKSESASLGEFLSTSWMILPENDKLILSEKFKNIEILEVEYLVNDYKTKLTIF